MNKELTLFQNLTGVLSRPYQGKG